MPNDGGHLILLRRSSRGDHPSAFLDPAFIRPFVGSQELINGVERRLPLGRTSDSKLLQMNNLPQVSIGAVSSNRAGSKKATTTTSLRQVHIRFR